ncbi:serine/threonine protein kinase, partial [Pyxidicoccus sp. 3LG]
VPGAVLLAGVALGVLGALLVREAWLSATGSALTGLEAGREVARERASPEIGRAAPPPSAVVPSRKEEPLVKTTPDAAVAPPSTATRVIKAVARTATTGALCTGLACSSTPPVRPPPPGVPCPKETVEGMKALGLRLGGATSASFNYVEDLNYLVTVREGEARMQLGPSLTKSEEFNGQTATGELVLGKRVYGRFTTIYNRDGDAFPVCLELRDIDLELGIPREPGDTGGAASARVRNTWRLVPVKRFE